MSKSDPQYTLRDQFLDQPYSLAGRVIDPVSGTLSWQGKREHLRRKELEVLALLASAEGKQVSRENFIAVVWQGNDLVGDRGLTNTLFFLRRSLGDESQQPLIRTIPRRGYQLTAAVRFLAAPDQQAIAEVQPKPVESLLAPGGTVADCPGWRLVRRLEQSPESESWLAEPSEFGELDQGLRVFRFCRSEAQLQRLRREVTLLRYLTQTLSDRADIVLIRDWQLEEPPYYLVCDYANAGSLHDFIKAGGLPNAPEKRLVLMQALAEALAAVHAHGVAHRQLSAQSVLVNQDDTGPRLLLSAFDLGALSDRTKLAPLNITAAGLTKDSEALSAESATAADVYALGGVLLQLALADAQALPNAQFLDQVTDTKVRALVAKCFDSSATRPSSEDVALALARIALPESQNGQSIASESEVPATALHKATPPSQLAPASMPDSIDSYRLLDRLGEGGMGAVYLAEQQDPYRKVALKIIRSGLDGKQILSRFEAERQALAMMNHPNVTTVLDSGLAADGRPYFAMEYVQGQEITAHCDAHHLNIHARIKLFLQVCDGVLHAHQKGVLHRDIKPSNLMVSSAPDSAGTVKIIDFGLAKSLHGKLAAHTLHTSFGAFIGTPVYSSPEHVVGAASGVDTRSDIYSMGVVLYELLAGMTPIANESLANLEPEKVREIVCKSKLPTMREQLQNTSEEKRKALAEHRAIKVDELPKTLEGDLSWVVGKCLERDPNDRYASVLALKEDLQRWLELRPVQARPASRWYRLRKLVRRNRGASALIAGSVASLLLTTSAAIVGFVRSESALERAEASSEEARKAADFQAAQIGSMDPQAMALSFRARILDALKDTENANQTVKQTNPTPRDPQEAIKQINFAELVTAQLNEHYFQPSLKLIEKDYGNAPRLKATLLQSLSSSMYGLGLIDAALEPQRQATAIRQIQYGADAPETLESQVKQGILLVDLNRTAEASRLLQDVIDRTRSVGADTPESLAAIAQLGAIESSLGKLDKAQARYQAAWSGAKNLLGENDLQTLGFATNLGSMLRKQQKLVEAEALMTPVLDALMRQVGTNHRSTLSAMQVLAQVRLNQSRFQEALDLGTEIVHSSELLYGRYALDTVSALNDLGLYWRGMGNHEKASELFTEALKRYEKIGLTGSDVLITQLNNGTSLYELGRLTESYACLQPILDAFIQQAGWDSEITLVTAYRMARIQIAQGRFVEAETLLKRVVAQRDQAQQPIHPAIALERGALGQALLALGKTDEATQTLAAALESSQKIVPEQPAMLLRVQTLLAQTLPASGPAPNGISLLGEIIAKQASTIGVTARDKVEAWTGLAQRLNPLGRSQEALRAADQAIEQARSGFSKDHYLLAAALLERVRAAVGLNKTAEAMNALIEAQQIIVGNESLDPAYRHSVDRLAVELGK